MGKLNEKNGLWQRTSRSLLAVSLAASLAAIGCTTNQNLGNGTPTRSGPDVRTGPTSGVTSGGESYTPPMPPPMTSSYSRPEVVPTTTRSIRLSPGEAAAIMAQHQVSRVRYLGVSNPGPNGGVVDPQSARVVDASRLVNPQQFAVASVGGAPVRLLRTNGSVTMTNVGQ